MVSIVKNVAIILQSDRKISLTHKRWSNIKIVTLMDSPWTAHLSLLLAVSLALFCMSVLRSAQPAWWRCQNGYRQLLWIYPWRCRPVQVRGPQILGFSFTTCCIMFWAQTLAVSRVCMSCRFPLLPLFKLGEGAVIPLLLQLDVSGTSDWKLHCVEKRKRCPLRSWNITQEVQS